MLFDIDWIEKNKEIVYFVNINGNTIFFSNYFYATFQYFCFIIIYVLLMKLIKDILNKNSDEYF